MKDYIIQSSVSDLLTVEDAKYHAEQCIALFETSERETIHMLLDMKDMKNYETRFGEVRNANQPLFQHKQSGWMVLYNLDSFSNPLIRIAINYITYLITSQVHIVETREQAIQFLQEKDTSLAEIEIP